MPVWNPNKQHMKNIITPWSILAALVVGTSLAHATSFNILPNTVTNDYSGSITLELSSLGNHQQVRIDRFADLNANGAVDPGEPLVQSYTVVDNETTSIAGRRNPNVPGDEDGGLNGQIRTVLNLRLARLNWQSGHYVIQVSSPTNGFEPVSRALEVVPVTYAQSISGKVLDGTNSIPYSAVAAIDVVSDTSRAGAMTDADGNYTLQVPPGVYRMVATQGGYYARKADLPVVEVYAGLSVATNIDLAQGTNIISGGVAMMGSGRPLAGLPLIFSSAAGEIAGAVTDENGQFSIKLNEETWTLTGDDHALAMLGLVNHIQTVAMGDLSQSNKVEFEPAAALVYGTLRNDANRVVNSLKVNALDPVTQKSAIVYGDPFGGYTLGVGEGAWLVGPSREELNSRGLLGAPVMVNTTNGLAVSQNFVFTRSTTRVQGKVIDPQGRPLVDYLVAGYTGGQAIGVARTGLDGLFDLRLTNGVWDIKLEEGEASQKGLFSTTTALDLTQVTEGSGIVIMAYAQGAPLAGMAVDGAGMPLTNTLLSATDANGIQIFGRTKEDGSFELPLYLGDWRLLVAGGDPSGLINPFLTFSLTNGMGETNVLFVAPRKTTSLTVKVVTLAGQPLANIPVTIQSTIGGTNYPQSAMTDAEGKTVVDVFEGVWMTSVSSNALLQLGYVAAPDQEIAISDEAQELTFVAQLPPPTKAPELKVIGFTTNGFELLITGEPKRQYRVQATTNLVDWVELDTVQLDTESAHYTHGAAGAYQHLIYRLITE